MNKYTYIDLFAGIGGIRIPFDELNYKCVFSSEWDKFAQKTYKENYGEEPFGDITKINPKDIPNCTILLAGFPCQPFSMAGKGLGFADTRGTLFFNIEAIIKEKRPKVFLLENVKRLKTHDNGRTFNVIKNKLESLNYTFDDKILSAKDFGVPQNRERIYMVGFDKTQFKLPNDFHFEFPKPLDIQTKVGDILEKQVDTKYTLSDKLWAGHLRRKEEHKNKGNGFGYSLFTKNSKYTSTLSARYYKDGSEILIEQINKNPRKLTPRECARLQGFPESFKIVVSDNQAYKQFGNSVAVPVIREIAKNINKILKEIDHGSKYSKK